MSLTRIGSIGINTGIAFAGVTTIVTLNTANDALSIGATVNVGSGITLGASGDIFATGVCTATSFVGSGANLTGVASTENIRTNTNATFLQNINVSGSTTTGSLVSSGAISGTTGTFTGDVDIADKIVHTGDTDTAIRFPAADTFTVETAGGERLRVKSDGSILHTAASGSTILTLKRSNTNVSGATGTINFAASDDHSVASIMALGDGDNEGANLSFRTTTAAASDDPYDSSIVERLRIDSSGDMGQGTATPTTPDGSNADNPNNGRVFTIYGDSPAINLIHNTAGGGSAGSTDYAAINFGRNGSSSNPYRAVIGYKQVEDILRINSNNIIAFDTGGSINTGERLRIDGSGYMGLGTNDPSSFNSYARNFVVAQSSGDAGITISAEDTSSEFGSLHFSGGTTVRSYIDVQNGTTGRMFLMNKMNGYMAFGTNNTEAVRIDSSGKLMVGGTTSDGKFAVIDSSYPDIAMRYNGTSGGHTTRLMFMDKRGVINAQVANNLQNDGVGTAAAHLEFATATGGTLSTAVRITDDGHVRKLRQPIFGYRGSSGWTTISNGNADTLALNHAVVASSDYNTSNYRYTVPTTGYYWFGCNLYSKHASADTSSSHYLSGGIRINGSAQTESNTIQHYLNASDGDTGYFISLFHYVNANDYLEVVLQASGADMQYYGTHCYFYGWLVA